MLHKKRNRRLLPGNKAGFLFDEVKSSMSDFPSGFNSDTFVPSASLCRVRPHVIRRFVALTNGVHFSRLSIAKRRLLARIARCRFSCELLLEYTAHIQGKRLEYVQNGIPVEDVPEE